MSSWIALIWQQGMKTEFYTKYTKCKYVWIFIMYIDFEGMHSLHTKVVESWDTLDMHFHAQKFKS